VIKRSVVLGALCSLGIGLALGTVGLSRFLGLYSRAKPNQTLLISAAASLQNVLAKVEPLFVQRYPNVRLKYNFGASGALQRQIEQGAPVDVFISAGKKQVDALQQKGLILNGTRRNLFTNRLVLIVPKNSTLGITTFRQLSQSSVRKIAVGEPRSVPVGQYTEELFKNLGILNSLKPKFVLGNNVRNVLAAVESGNVDVGVVYATDAKVLNQTQPNQIRQVATAPSRLHAPIVYPLAVLKASQNSQAAQAYVQFLASAKAKAIFQQYGFGIVP
jgi:molybdate transport system substrate-binding protein